MTDKDECKIFKEKLKTMEITIKKINEIHEQELKLAKEKIDAAFSKHELNKECDREMRIDCHDGDDCFDIVKRELDRIFKEMIK